MLPGFDLSFQVSLETFRDIVNRAITEDGPVGRSRAMPAIGHIETVDYQWRNARRYGLGSLPDLPLLAEVLFGNENTMNGDDERRRFLGSGMLGARSLHNAKAR